MAWLKDSGSPQGDHLRRRDLANLLGTGVIVTVCVMLLGIFRPDLYVHVEHKAFDVLFSQTRLREPGPVPVLVSIDDKALNLLGQWPWPRVTLAGVISRLREAGVRNVVLDLVLSNRDQTSPRVVLESLLKSPDLARTMAGRPQVEVDFDHALAQSLASVPTVLGYKLLFSPTAEQCPCILRPLQTDAIVPPSFRLHEAQSVICALPALARTAVSGGFINAAHDLDGAIRRVPLMALHESNLLPGLTLAMVRLAEGKDAVLGNDQDGGFVQLGRNRIHTDDRGNMLLRFRGPSGTFETISAAEILEGPLPDLSGRVAIVGPTAAGLGDNHVTPLDRSFPGIEIHATALDNILQNDFLRRPSWAVGAEAVSVMVLGVLSTLLIIIGGPLTCVAGLVAGSLGLWSASLWLLDVPGYWLSPLPAVFVLVLNLAVLSLIKYGIEEHKLRIRSQQLLHTQDAIILGLTSLAETRDPETGGHIRRTQEYVRALAQRLARQPKYRNVLTPVTIELLYKCAPLHDIGKVGIADSILLKPDRLTDEEFTEMQRHTILGADTLADAARHTTHGAEQSFLALARDIAVSHHEKWDGSGYPYGLAGEEIPLGGRLMALADVYDALVTKRVYKEAMTHEEAVEIITQGRGVHFDPAVVDAFLESETRFRDILTRYS
ncbi:MAG TPA: metal-dependent phosphohydrolase [Desulfomicrobium sp.]|nr:metal-dependent phosphohydrolase [Desulfomicrobium sp.]